MKTAFTALLFLTASALLPVSAQEPFVDDVVQPFFSAMQNGDVGTLSRLIDGKLLAQTHTLLSRNSQYPQQLRDRYQNAEFLLDEIRTDGQHASIMFTIAFSDGNNKSFVLRLTRNPQNNDWKIVEYK